MTLTEIIPTEVHREALAAAQQNAATREKQLGPERLRGLDCGFAWVHITPACGKFVNWCKSAGIGKKHWESGWYIWGSDLHSFCTQSIGTHEAAAAGYASVLRKYGINATVDSRLD